MQSKKSRLVFLSIIFSACKSNIGIDPDIAEFNSRERKDLKWAIKKKFVNLSLGRTVAITERGISYLKNNDSSLYNKSLEVIKSKTLRREIR